MKKFSEILVWVLIVTIIAPTFSTSVFAQTGNLPNLEKYENDFVKKAGAFISKNGKLKYSPVIDGKKYHYYTFTDSYVEYSKQIFSTKASKGALADYLLDSSNNLVLDSMIQFKAQCVDDANLMIKGGECSIEKLEYYLTFLKSTEEAYKQAEKNLNWGSALGWLGNKGLGLSVTGAKAFAIYVNGNLSLADKTIIDDTVSQAIDLWSDVSSWLLEDKLSKTEGTTFYTKKLIRELASEQNRLAIEHCNKVLSILRDSKNYHNGFLNNYNSAVEIKKTTPMISIYLEYAKMDYKYLSAELDKAEEDILADATKTITETILSEKFAINDMELISVAVAGVEQAQTIEYAFKNAADPDIQKMYRRVQGITESYYTMMATGINDGATTNDLLFMEYENNALDFSHHKFDDAFIADIQAKLNLYKSGKLVTSSNIVLSCLTDDVLASLLDSELTILEIALFAQYKNIDYYEYAYGVSIGAYVLDEIKLNQEYRSVVEKIRAEKQKIKDSMIPIKSGDKVDLDGDGKLETVKFRYYNDGSSYNALDIMIDDKTHTEYAVLNWNSEVYVTTINRSTGLKGIVFNVNSINLYRAQVCLMLLDGKIQSVSSSTCNETPVSIRCNGDGIIYTGNISAPFYEMYNYTVTHQVELKKESRDSLFITPIKFETVGFVNERDYLHFTTNTLVTMKSIEGKVMTYKKGAGFTVLAYQTERWDLDENINLIKRIAFLDDNGMVVILNGNSGMLQMGEVYDPYARNLMHITLFRGTTFQP